VGSLVVNRASNFSCGTEACLHQNCLGGVNLPWFLPESGTEIFVGPLEAVVMSSLMLVCAVAASLAFGVLVAYGVCHVMFRVFRVHATAVARERGAAAVRVAIEG
jgi:hypothetical protein